jgi:hypothetical protein
LWHKRTGKQAPAERILPQQFDVKKRIAGFLDETENRLPQDEVFHRADTDQRDALFDTGNRVLKSKKSRIRAAATFFLFVSNLMRRAASLSGLHQNSLRRAASLNRLH